MRQFLIELITQNSRLSFSAFFSIAQSGDKRNRFFMEICGKISGYFRRKNCPVLGGKCRLFSRKSAFLIASPLANTGNLSKYIKS